MKERYAIMLLIATSALQSALFVWANAHCMTLSTDMAIIGGFMHNFSHSLLDGTFYPRWLGGQFDKTGAPVFVIYSPLSFFIGSIFTLPEHLDPFGVYQLGLAMGLGIVCMALASYIWLRRHASAGMSLFLASVLLLVPNRFLLMQIQTGLAAIWATVWFILALYYLEQWREVGDKRFLAGFSFMLALILLTHMPSALLFWPALALYGCFYQTPAARALGGLCIAFALALGLSSIYLIPALLNRPYISFSNYLQFFADYNVMFLKLDSVLFYFVPKILMDALPFVMLALVSLWLARPGSAVDKHRSVVRLFGLIILATSFLFTPLTKSLWEQSALLHWLQAPFRFLALFFVLSPVLLLWMSKRLKPLVFGIFILIFLLPTGWRAWNDYEVRRNVSSTSNAQGIIQKNLISQAAATEYKTVWMPATLQSPGNFTTAYANLGLAEYISGAGEVKIQSWKDERIALHVDASTPATLRVRQNYFPAWRASVDDRIVSIHPDALGLMLVNVPAGSSDLVLSFSGLAGSTLGSTLSLASFLVLIALMVLPSKRELTFSFKQRVYK